MARRYQANIIYQATTGVPEDHVVNTFHFYPSDGIGGVVADEAAGIAGALANAFTTVHAGSTLSPAQWLNSTISRTVPPKIQVYKSEDWNDLTDMGPPVYETAFAAMPATGAAGGLPRETALCLSYHAHLSGFAENVAGGVAGPEGDSHPRAQRRGRIFFGPLTGGAASATAGRPHADLIRDLAAAGNYLLNAPQLVVGPIVLVWAVYSRRNNLLNEVTGGWVDDEWDTQRRRGLKRTTRTIFGTGLD